MRHGPISVRLVWGIFVLPLAACATNSQIAFYERAQTAIAVGLSPSAPAPEPVEVSIAYKREVYAAIPPVKDTDGIAEAKSLISNYQVKAGTFWSGGKEDDLMISNGFATGEAAKIAANSPKATQKLFGLVQPFAGELKLDQKILLTAVAPCLKALRDAGQGRADVRKEVMRGLRYWPEYERFTSVQSDETAQYNALYQSLTSNRGPRITNILLDILSDEAGEKGKIANCKSLTL